MPLFSGPSTAPAVSVPSDHGFKTWSYDPALTVSVTLVPAGGVLNLVRLPVNGTTTIGTVWTHVTTAGASLTNVGFALYTTAGALLTSSVNVNGATATAFQSLGLKPVTFTAQSVTNAFYVGFWFTGTTMPTLSRGTSISSLNANLAAPNFRFATANTSLTTTAPAPFGTQTAAPQAWWVAAA